jgi:uncharacterized protein with HEPN domain
MSRDQASLLDVARADELVLTFKQDVDKEMFHHDIKTQSAILHQLLIMGEAVKRLSMPFRDAHPEIDWKSIAGLRDILIHGYDIVDLDLVWVIAKEQVPKLLKQLTPLLPRQDS